MFVLFFVWFADGCRSLCVARCLMFVVWWLIFVFAGCYNVGFLVFVV